MNFKNHSPPIVQHLSSTLSKAYYGLQFSLCPTYEGSIPSFGASTELSAKLRTPSPPGTTFLSRNVPEPDSKDWFSIAPQIAQRVTRSVSIRLAKSRNILRFPWRDIVFAG